MPVEPGETYSWWVHKPGLPGVATKFSVSRLMQCLCLLARCAHDHQSARRTDDRQAHVRDARSSSRCRVTRARTWCGSTMRIGTAGRRPASQHDSNAALPVDGHRRTPRSRCRSKRVRRTVGGCTSRALPAAGCHDLHRRAEATGGRLQSSDVPVLVSPRQGDASGGI